MLKGVMSKGVMSKAVMLKGVMSKGVMSKGVMSRGVTSKDVLSKSAVPESALSKTASTKRGAAKSATSNNGTGWTFLSNHTHVLVCLSADGEQTLREVAGRVGITERGVQRIVAELEDAGVLRRERGERDARRNRYVIDSGVFLRHPLEAHCRLGELLRLVTPRKLAG